MLDNHAQCELKEVQKSIKENIHCFHNPIALGNWSSDRGPGI